MRSKGKRKLEKGSLMRKKCVLIFGLSVDELELRCMNEVNSLQLSIVL